MKAAIYARVSTDDKGQDPENQIKQLKAFINRRGWELGPEFVDYVSGKRADNRKEFNNAFDAAHKSEYDILVFWSLDRFTREGARACLNYLDQLEKLGAGWVSYTERYLDTTGPFKDALIAIMAALAKQERVRIGERVKAAHEKKAAEAEKNGKEIKWGRPQKIDRARVLAAYKEAGTFKGATVKLNTEGLKISRPWVAKIVKGEV